MSSGIFSSPFCCICFEPLTVETAAVDKDGTKWDVCVGECAEAAGIDTELVQ